MSFLNSILYQIILPVQNLLTRIVLKYIQPLAVFLSNRGRKIFFNLFLGTIFLYGLFILYQSYNAYLFRKHPGNLTANNYFKSLAPHHIIPRMILYVPGSKEYNAHIVYLSNKISNRLDCLFINKIEQVAKKELIIEMASTMLNFGGCVANSILSDKRINSDDLDRIIDGQTIDNIILDAVSYQKNNPSLVDFIGRNLVKQNNTALFENTIPYISAIENDVDYIYLFNKYYNDVQIDNRSELIRNFSIIFNDKNINHIKKFYDSVSSLFSNDEKKYLIYSIMLKSELFDKTWFNPRLSDVNDFKFLHDSHYLVDVDNGSFDHFRSTGFGGYDIIKLILLAKELESIDQHASSLIYHVLIHRIQDALDTKIDDIMGDCNDCSENEYTEWLEKYDDAKKIEKEKMRSEQPYKQIFVEINRILNNPSDSELKKNMLVLAYRSVDVLNIYPKNIDEAFLGTEPRSMLFTKIEDYLAGSDAITEYEEITEHNYISFAKLWPLNSYSRNDSNYIQSKYNKWKNLIKKYPWHPSIDDMYLRLAFDQFNLKQYAQGFSEITQYFSKENRLDTSADTRLRALLLYYLQKLDKNSLNGEYKILKDVYNIPYCLFDKTCAMPPSSDINTLRQNEIVFDSSIFNDNQLETLEDMLRLSKNEILKQAKSKDSYKSVLYDITLIHVEDEDCDSCIFSIEPIYGNQKKSIKIENIKKILDYHFGGEPDSYLSDIL